MFIQLFLFSVYSGGHAVLSLRRSHSVLLGVNRASRETHPVAQEAVEQHADDLRIRPQRESLSIRSVHVDYSSGASSPSSARSAPNQWPTGKRPCTFEQRQQYKDIINRLSLGLDHLINVRKSSRHFANCLYSFFEGTQADMHENFRDRVLIERWQAMANSAGSIFTTQPEDTVRMIFIQDLSTSVPEALGFYQQLNPEFFEEHLNRSGYHEASYQDPLPHTWKTNFVCRRFRPYASKWTILCLGSLALSPDILGCSEWSHLRCVRSSYYWCPFHCGR